MAGLGESVCIICGKKKRGIPIKEDWVIHAVRWFKANVTKNEKSNLLVVCRECYISYRKAREKFMTRLALYLALGIVFVVIGLLINTSFETFLITVSVLVVLYLLALVSYMPALEIPAGKGKGMPQKAAGKADK